MKIGNVEPPPLLATRKNAYVFGIIFQRSAADKRWRKIFQGVIPAIILKYYNLNLLTRIKCIKPFYANGKLYALMSLGNVRRIWLNNPCQNGCFIIDHHQSFGKGDLRSISIQIYF